MVLKLKVSRKLNKSLVFVNSINILNSSNISIDKNVVGKKKYFFFGTISTFSLCTKTVR